MFIIGQKSEPRYPKKCVPHYYCKDAYKLFGIKILCGKDCPIYKTCPYTVLGDTADKNAKKIMKEIIRLNEKGRD